MRLVSAVSAVLALALLSPLAVLAQDAPLAPALSVPRLVNFSGVFQPANGQPSARRWRPSRCRSYAEQDGGLPLWQEMQTVTVETTGRFTVLLGASHPDGLPPAVDECPNCLTRLRGVFEMRLASSRPHSWLADAIRRRGARGAARTRLSEGVTTPQVEDARAFAAHNGWTVRCAGMIPTDDVSLYDHA